MSDENMLLRVPYTLRFVRKGQRRWEAASFWSELPFEIRKVDPDLAPPAYRITQERGYQPKFYFVRSFANALWWPLIDAEGLVSPSRFATLAASGHVPLLTEVLGVLWDRPREETPEEFYAENPYSKIVSCTREQQWVRAQRGLYDWIVFCGDQTLLQADEPIYFVVSPWPGKRYKIVAGTASLDRDPDLRHSGIGSGRAFRQRIASENLAFEADEIDEASCPLADRVSDGYESRIEALASRAPTGTASLCCARAFVDGLWARSQFDTPEGRLLRRSVSALSEVDHDLARLREMPARDVLQEFVSLEDTTARVQNRYQIGEASKILERLIRFFPTPFAQEDDDALGRLI